MSSENVEIIRRGFEGVNRVGMEALLDLMHPDFEATVSPELSVEPDTYRGEEGMRRYFAAFEGVMEDVHFDADELIGSGDKVFVSMRLTAKGMGTGIEVEQRAYQVWTMRDGKALRADSFGDRSDALEAAGLAEAGPGGVPAGP